MRLLRCWSGKVHALHFDTDEKTFASDSKTPLKHPLFSSVYGSIDIKNIMLDYFTDRTSDLHGHRSRHVPLEPPVAPHARTLATLAVDSPFPPPLRLRTAAVFKPYARRQALFPAPF